MTEQQPTDFERVVGERVTDNALTDFVYFLRHSRKWWLVPLLMMLLMLGGLMLLSSTAAAPFIYTLF